MDKPPYEKRKAMMQQTDETALLLLQDSLRSVQPNDDEAFDMLYDAHGGKYGPEIPRAVADMYNEIR